MINYEGLGGRRLRPKVAKNGQFFLDWAGLTAHGGTMNGFLAICSICREIIS
jgi:hypothetical protein